MRNEKACVTNPNDFVTCPGDRKHIIYSSVIDDQGVVNLVESGYEDIQEYIDSFREQTDMSWIIAQMNAGNDEVLHRNVEFYGDFTNFPKTYAEALQRVMDSEKKFEQLPVDVKNSFDNDFKKWFATAGSEKWMEFMEPVLPKKEKEIEKEVEE